MGLETNSEIEIENNEKKHKNKHEANTNNTNNSHNHHQCTANEWEDWRPTIYKFPWGYSVTRGCLFSWIFLSLPTILYNKYKRKIYKLAYPTPEDDGDILNCIFASILLTIISVIWIIVLIILFIPWVILFVIAGIIEFIISIIYHLTCGCCAKEKKKIVWRTFSWKGWTNDWTDDFDQNTADIWEDWSPIRNTCDYNFPPF